MSYLLDHCLVDFPSGRNYRELQFAETSELLFVFYFLWRILDMNEDTRKNVEQQFEALQTAVLDMQKVLDIQAPGEPLAVRSCTSCLSNSCNQPASLQQSGQS